MRRLGSGIGWGGGVRLLRPVKLDYRFDTGATYGHREPLAIYEAFSTTVGTTVIVDLILLI